MEWELTDEEMREVLNKEFYDPRPNPKCRPIAKAQAKKLVEWLTENMEFYQCPMCDNDYHLTQKQMQQLLKEVGLE